MAEAVITPIFAADVGTSLADLTSGPASGEEWVVAIRVTNKNSSPRTYRLLLQNTAGSSLGYRAYDYNVDGNDAVDIETALAIPNGYKLRHLASATSSLDVTMTGRKRSTT